MSSAHSPVIAVSSWEPAPHHRPYLVGETPGAAAVRKEAYGKGNVAILDLPAAIAKHGIRRLQLCHFHVADRGKTWLGEYRAACRDAGVTLQTLLVDDADISDAATHQRDIAWISKWIDTAAEIGAEAARVVAGKQKPSAATLALSVAGLKQIVARGKAAGVRVVTENWHDLLSGPHEVNHVLDAVGSDLGLLADFGNWKGPTKYDGLVAIMPRAEDTHAKCSFSGQLSAAGSMDSADYGRCVAIADAAGYAGPYTLIYDGPDDDEWACIAAEEAFIRQTLAGKSRRTA